MAILRDILATAITPQVAVASRRRRNMANPFFYNDEEQQAPANEDATNNAIALRRTAQYANEPVTGNYIASGLDRIANRKAPPQLEPSARVRIADMSKTAPDNFKSFYDMLGLINQRGSEMLGAAQAQAAYKRQQQAAALAAQQVQGFNLPTLQSGGGGSKHGNAYGNGVPSNPRENFKFAQNIAGNYGWNNPKELSAWYTLGMKESGWRNTAQNPISTAYGIGQFLNGTWGRYGIPKTSDPALQVEAMARYIRHRYGSPSAALAFHYRNNWY